MASLTSAKSTKSTKSKKKDPIAKAIKLITSEVTAQKHTGIPIYKDDGKTILTYERLPSILNQIQTYQSLLTEKHSMKDSVLPAIEFLLTKWVIKQNKKIHRVLTKSKSYDRRKLEADIEMLLSFATIPAKTIINEIIELHKSVVENDRMIDVCSNSVTE